MADNTTVTINGVKYEFSKEDYHILEILKSRARVIEKENPATNASKASGIEKLMSTMTPAAKPAAPTSAIVREPVTTTTLQRVMGVHYTECTIYDCENNNLLTQKYNGITVDWDDNDTKNAKSFKEWFDKEFKKENLTLVYNVSKQVSEISYPGWGKWTREGQEIRINKNGYCTVCNFIVRDETTGKLQMLNDAAWLGVGNLVYPYFAARYGAYYVADRGAWNSDFRSVVRAGYQRNKHATR